MRLFAAFTAATALTIGATGASAHERDPHPGGTALDRRAATIADAEVLAKQDRLEVEAALAHLEDSRRFTHLVTELSEKHADTFASARYAEDPGDASVVRFVGEPPKDAVALIDEFRLPVEVTGHARYTEQALQDRAAKVHEHLAESGFEQVATATTTEDGVVATVFGKGSTKLPRELAAGVRVTVVEEPLAVDEHTYGGGQLLFSGTNWCTTGFSVRDLSSGVTGTSTAGHCDEVDQYDESPSAGDEYGITLQDIHYGFWGDVAWGTTSHWEPAEYWARSNERREVNSVSGLLPVGVPSCIYGRASNNRACDDIHSNFVTMTINGATHWFLMAMENDNTIGGDSGGPWSFGTEADGIHKGDLTLDGGRRNVWTRASLMPVSLGVEVRTQ